MLCQNVRICFSCLLLIAVCCFGACQPTTSAPVPPAVTNEVRLFAEGTVSTALYERDLSISAGGDYLIYTLGDYKQSRRCLVQRKRTETGFGAAEILSFSGTHQDIEPFLTQDGNRLYFASNRPIYGDTSRQDYNIWYSDHNGTDWGAPVSLDSTINTSKDEFYPALTADGVLYFTATRSDGIGREDIFEAMPENGRFAQPTVLDTTINTAVYEFNAYVSPDGQLLVFSAYGRRDGYGGGDLYYSKKGVDGNWLPAKNMGPEINSPKLDYCPFIDWEQGVFYFTSERQATTSGKLNSVEDLLQQANRPQNGFGDIYQVKLDALGLE